MWQYRAIPRSRQLEEVELNRIGRDGWEMCGVLVKSESRMTYYFKKPYEKASNDVSSGGTSHAGRNDASEVIYPAKGARQE